MQIKRILLPSVSALFAVLALMLAEMPVQSLAQTSSEPLFELPVQLVGFPVIILAVRLSNFVKKLSYSLNPQTYQSRSRRSLVDAITETSEVSRSAIDISIAEKQILAEFGPKACVMEEPCRVHAARLTPVHDAGDWTDIVQHYKVQASGMKQWYLLSVYIGDVMRDVPLCKQLAKRLDCARNVKPIVRD